MALLEELSVLQNELVRCRLCPRFREHSTKMAAEKRRAYRDLEYWGKPVPAFGDPEARVLILGLAPAAHGANRTGRLFTGDRSGEFLYRALYETGFASQAESVARGDGLRLTDCWISASVRCAPPDNKPELAEFDRCRPFFIRELQLLKNLQVVVC